VTGVLANRQLTYSVVDTRLGWMGVLASAAGLRRLTLPRPSIQEATVLLGPVGDGAQWSPQLFVDLAAKLQAYLRGQRVDFTDALDLYGATDFQHRVWRTARQIGYGQTRSYRWLAGCLGRPEAARAVGQALARNPLPIIIPCHRVVATSGRLGGFSGGVETKARLLHLEGVAINH